MPYPSGGCIRAEARQACCAGAGWGAEPTPSSGDRAVGLTDDLCPCGKPAHARGLCATCYGRARRSDPTRPRCSSEGCPDRATARGLCAYHYAILRREETRTHPVPSPPSSGDVQGSPTPSTGQVGACLTSATSCAACGLTPLVARGLCRSCYDAYRYLARRELGGKVGEAPT